GPGGAALQPRVGRFERSAPRVQRSRETPQLRRRGSCIGPEGALVRQEGIQLGEGQGRAGVGALGGPLRNGAPIGRRGDRPPMTGGRQEQKREPASPHAKRCPPYPLTLSRALVYDHCPRASTVAGGGNPRGCLRPLPLRPPPAPSCVPPGA